MIYINVYIDEYIYIYTYTYIHIHISIVSQPDAPAVEKPRPQVLGGAMSPLALLETGIITYSVRRQYSLRQLQ